MSTKFLQTVVLAAATLLLLIALPMVNCRRHNALRIEELEEDLSAKDNDHGKGDNGMNKAMNAYSSDLRIIKREEDACSIAFEALKRLLKKECPCMKFNERVMCENATGLKHCHCTGSEDCVKCEWKKSEDRLAL